MFTKISTFLPKYLTPINTLVLPFTVLNGALDFLGGSFAALRGVVFAVIGLIFVGMATLAIRERWQSRLASGEGETTPGRWNRPYAHVLVALLGISTLFGGVSMAYANKGGVIVNAYPPMKDVQQAMLGVLLDVKADTAEIKAEVAKISRHMDNPRAQLKSRGFEVTSFGLLEAIKQRDEEAVALFAAARLRVDRPAPLGFLLNDYWDPKIAALLTEEMFPDENACLGGSGGDWREYATFLGIYTNNLRPDQPEKAATFKRLCKSDKVRDYLAKQVREMPERLVTKPGREDSPERLEQYRWALGFLGG
jgi:hypothetical protein